MVQYVGTRNLSALVASIGLERFFVDLVAHMERDFARWPAFEKCPRVASHSRDGVIELMPTSDGTHYGFKYVNGHPRNTRRGLQTVTAFGMLADVATGYPVFLSEMTLATALRTAAASALAARHLARRDARAMTIIGLGAQSEFQALAFKAVLGITALRVYDSDPSAAAKFAANLQGYGLSIAHATSAADAVVGADIITTVTADKARATILTDNMVGAGVHINAVGGDCPGKTELHRDILLRSGIFVEYAPQTRIEGEIQQLPTDHPVTELWEVVTGVAAGRTGPHQVTLFDSVGFAIEDFSMLTFLREAVQATPFWSDIDLIAQPEDPKNLFALIAAPERTPARCRA